MLKNYSVEDILFEYTKTSATILQIARKHHVRVGLIRSLLLENFGEREFEKLKAKKHQLNKVSANLRRYKLQHGL